MKRLFRLRIAFVINLLLICSFSFAEDYKGVEYVTPSGWKAQDTNGAIGFLPNDVTPQTGTVLVLGPAQNLEGIAFDVWFQQKLKEELQDGSKVIQESEIKKQQQGNLATATLVRVTQEADGSSAIRMYHAVTDGKKAAMAIAMSVSKEGTDKYAPAIQNFFSSLRISGQAADSPSIRPSTQSGNPERVPESGIVNGIPQGMFVGRSLLTGKAVCLLFLNGGRITRAIPQNGLEHFDWTKHQQEHSGDSGTWEIHGNSLRVIWGDSGVNEGPLTVTSDGIEFYGKRYARPTTVGIAAIVGKWEAARGTAIWGGEGINMTHTLIIDRDGSFRWDSGTGGVVDGRAVANETNRSGKLRITGSTMIFVGNDGAEESYTFVPLPGNPIVAFSLASNMFTRAD